MKKDTSNLKDRLLLLMRKAGYQPLDRAELGKALGVHSSERRVMADVLNSLENSGAIARIRKDRYILPSTADLVTGVLQVHAGGNAHLLDESGGRKDVFIFAGNLGTAMHGDKVVARLELGGRGPRRGDSAEGRVIRILERKNTTIVGTLQTTKKFFYVIPDDSRLQHDVYVPPPKEARIGDKVVVKLEPWESRHVNPEGEIIEVLGPASAPGIDMLSINHIIDIIRALKAAGGSVLLITHQEEVALIADRASQLCAGRIIFSGGPREAVDHFRGRTCVRCDGEVCNYVRA